MLVRFNRGWAAKVVWYRVDFVFSLFPLNFRMDRRAETRRPGPGEKSKEEGKEENEERNKCLRKKMKKRNKCLGKIKQYSN